MRLPVLSLCLCCTLARAEDMANWTVVGDWKILVNDTTGYSCLAQKDYDDGTRVQIGFDITRNGGFFAAYRESWSQIVVGETSVLRFEFDDARFAGDAMGRTSGELRGGYAFFDNPSFVDEFAKRDSVKISGENGVWFQIDLSGSRVAIDAVRTCQKSQPTVLSK